MVKLYICKICGEPYLGGEAPDDCPFCGAPKHYMRAIEDYSVLWDVEISEEEKKDMKETLGLEINAAAYYYNVSEANEDYSEQNRLFKQLGRVEEEHARTAANFLKVKFPALKGEKTKGSIKADLKRTKKLEEDAIMKYTGFLKNAVNPKVKNFYVALIHAEKGHKEIASEGLAG